MSKTIVCFIVALSSIANVSMAAELAIKYDFVPKKTYLYQTAVVVPKANNQQIEPMIIKPQLHHYAKMRSNVQVVAARNYADIQPLAPTISLSYPSKAKESTPVVIAASNYYKNEISVTTSDLGRDYLNTFVVGQNDKSEGFESQSKLTDFTVEQKIARNPLLGCAPLSINCTRTARDSESLKTQRDPVTATKGAKQRQLLPN